MLFAIQSQTSLSMRDLKIPLLLFFIVSPFSVFFFFFFFFRGGVQSTRGSTFSSQAPYAFYFEKKKVPNFIGLDGRADLAQPPYSVMTYCR